MKFGLYLMNFKGCSVLKYLIQNNMTPYISYVKSSKDAKIENDSYVVIKKLCSNNQIKFYNNKQKEDEKVDYKIAVGWRWLIDDYLNLIVLHDSLLPKYRGFAPLVSCLINGEKELGVTALFANKEYDQGDILHQESITINYPIKIEKAIILISELYQKIVLNLFKNIIAGIALESIQQINKNASYSIWLDEEDYFIDWSETSEKIKRKIDAVGYPYLGARTKLGNQILVIRDSEIIDELKIENRVCGKIFRIHQGNPIVICGSGLLKLTKIEDLNGTVIKLNKLRQRFI